MICVSNLREVHTLVWQLGKNRSRWKTTDQVVMQWLQERQSLLIVFNELCHTHKDADIHTQSYLMQSFCQRLMDYVSMGHFKIFEKLADAQANCSPTRGELDKNLVSRILNSTLYVLEFNDNYEKSPQTNRLTEDLSELGQELAHRMDWEDQLIKIYLEVTSEEAPRLSAASF